MKKKTLATTLILIILVIVLGVFSGITYQETLEQEQEIQKLEENLHNLSKDYSDLLEEHENLEGEHQELESDYSELTEEHQELINEFSELETDYQTLSQEYEILKEELAFGSTEYYALGIKDDEDEGTVSSLTAKIIQGEGSIYIDVTNHIFGETTQKASQTSIVVANQYTDLDLNNDYSALISWGTDADIIDGPSAGAAETLTIISAANNQEIDTEIMITGTINQDGTIGAVGAIEEKANAAKEHGAHTILVPDGQHEEIEGIEVIEVTDIEEAMDHLGLK
ncbi:S16 family serine protease [Methanonatronarchaeum sp. AMET-Sl]|uniref:S16 family serine protease n=1 Tax=Methanonatronarchaeum sp. AMET-Sl TaxID=3037654 RepID=UPI00244E0327|nr:S16 family serine protease [Methanonatronarchaeum sp. AMET-Sl]WGI18077.1 hypothetical protein QEN48_03490 [Methanonatronarchaeum sp. AMET-Sl]